MFAIARRSLGTVAFLFAVLAIVLTPFAAAAQEMDSTFYGYFDEDATTAIMLNEAEFDTYGMAGAMVSPAIVDSFFDGFDLIEDPEITRSLKTSEVAIVSEADEYLVYEGDLDFYDGVAPGFVIFVSTDEKMFIAVGYIADRSDIFDIVEAAIEQGSAPIVVGDFVRMELDS